MDDGLIYIKFKREIERHSIPHDDVEITDTILATAKIEVHASTTLDGDDVYIPAKVNKDFKLTKNEEKVIRSIWDRLQKSITKKGKYYD